MTRTERPSFKNVPSENQIEIRAVVSPIDRMAMKIAGLDKPIGFGHLLPRAAWFTFTFGAFFTVMFTALIWMSTGRSLFTLLDASTALFSFCLFVVFGFINAYREPKLLSKKFGKSLDPFFDSKL